MIGTLGPVVVLFMAAVTVAKASSLGSGMSNGSPTNYDGPIYHCAGTGAQEVMDLDETLGMWYVVELVHHRFDAKIPRGDSYVDTCPIVYLAKTHDSHRRETGLRLTWSESAGNLYYNFNVDTVGRPGFWISSGPQNGNSSNLESRIGADRFGTYGSMTNLPTPYRQFAGIVEVTKAVGSHMVLTFCMPGQQLYTVVLAREKSLPRSEIRGVNSLLERKGLQRIATREACHGAAAIHRATFNSILIFLVTFSYISRT